MAGKNIEKFQVYEGLWNETTRVALKRLHEKSEFEKFRKEASLLQYK